ncbi:MAG: glucuronosyltransferase [Pseudomonadota bacterium]
MIFLTLGSHQPFDRLVEALDHWATDRDVGNRIFGQITPHATYKPKAFEHRDLLDPSEYRERCKDATFIVSHAGMGTIITALTYRTPAVMMARRAHLGEMRNDHQVATAERFASRQELRFIMEAPELGPICDDLLANADRPDGDGIAPFAEDQLIGTVRDFIFR